ncbi:hypothetical protein BpHYR1_026415 [Brachionus plicatilis]|uniref:Uncharacterized protein n=1 Tax=Brachionus plicatilis TaxID=10195 RepID=A0A3M7PIF9_BRAPC|nr:hypothetical protein BpHYR1_026415 [Brachionus plicatilis]
MAAKYVQEKDFPYYLNGKMQLLTDKCFRRIMKIELSDLNDALDQIDENRFRLNQTEFTKLTEIVKILEPFEYVTNEFQDIINNQN